MQPDAPRQVLHVFLHSLARVACVVVHRKVQVLMAAVTLAQMVEQPDEKLLVCAFPQDPMKTSRGEVVERPGDPHLAVGCWSAKGLVLCCAHPAEAHFGVGFEFGLVLEERGCLLRHLQDIQEPRTLLLDVLLGAFLGLEGAWPPPAEAQAVQRAPQCLPAHERGGLLLKSWRAMSLQLQRSWRAQPAVLGGRLPFDQTLDPFVCRLLEQRFRAAPLAVIEGRSSLLGEAIDDGVEGGA